jgi:hypothetical protein
MLLPSISHWEHFGSETVAAGTFDTFKIEITSADGGNDHETYWIAKDSRKP